MQGVVQFVKNIGCFMTLKDGMKNGELDQLVLLKQGLYLALHDKNINLDFLGERTNNGYCNGKKM